MTDSESEEAARIETEAENRRIARAQREQELKEREAAAQAALGRAEQLRVQAQQIADSFETKGTSSVGSI